MTAEELISGVLDDLERPDLADVARRRMLQALYETHGIAFFERDKVYEDTPVVSGQSYLEIDKPARFRKLATVQALDSAGEVVFDAFKNKQTLAKSFNYFGFQEPNTFRLNGSIIRVDFGSDVAAMLNTSIAAIRVWYWQYPTWDVTDGVASSDSWILEEFPGPVMCALAVKLASFVDDDSKFSKFRASLQDGHLHLLNNYSTDIPVE